MKKGTPISDIMTKNVITINTIDDLETAEALFKKYNIRHIPVVNEEKILGMLSYTDLMRISFADAIGEEETDVDTVVYNMFTISQVMVKNVVTIDAKSTIKEVAEVLASNEFHALPVTENNKLVVLLLLLI